MKNYRGRITIDVKNIDFTSLSTPSGITINEIERDKVHLYNEENESCVRKIEIYAINSSIVTVTISFQDDVESPISISSSLSTLSDDLETYFPDEIRFVCHVYVFDDSWFNSEFVNYTEPEVNCIFYYNTNSPANKITKTLNFVNSEVVQYTRPISNRSVVLDLTESINNLKFNYVYLNILNRYYYLDDKQMIKDHSVLFLSEDVLMSWDNLIRQQTGFIERNQNDYNLDKVDDYVSFTYDKKIDYMTVTDYIDLFDINNPPPHPQDFYPHYVVTVVSALTGS